jgi:heme oxygenase
MARIFSIDFFYKNASHRAMIAVRQTPFHTEYKITLQSIELTDTLLSDKIVSPAEGIFVFANTSVHEYNELMHQILSAVKDHVHSVSQ